MGLFSRGPKPEDYHVVRDRCWSDPALDALYDAVADRTRPADARVSLVLQHLAAVRDDAERLVCAAIAVDDLLIDDLDAVRAAAASPTGDRAADTEARTLLAWMLVATAWSVRGGGRSSTVSDEAFAVFHRILEEAEEVGYQALELSPGHPLAAVARLASGRGLGLPPDEWWARFNVARQIRPTLYPAHTHMLQALCRKWYGSSEVMFDFARKVAAEAPVGDPVGAILAIAHVEHLLDTGKLDVPPADLELARQAADRWIAGGEEAMAAHPRAYEAHQLFGWLLRADQDRRRFHLSRSMGRMSDLPWNYLRDKEQAYRVLMAKVKVRY